MQTHDFDYRLPADLIAQIPLPRRDQSRLLLLHRHSQSWTHRQFTDLPQLLEPGDVLVLNDSRVIPARLRGFKPATGGQIEVLLLSQKETNLWWTMLRPGKRLRPGTRLHFLSRQGHPANVTATVIEKNPEGHGLLHFDGAGNLLHQLPALGEMPLPPYITRQADTGGVNDQERYQTVFALTPGSVAAPTAGLHFTVDLINKLKSNNIKICYITLHVGPGTFAPVKTADLSLHPMHEEVFEISPDTVQTILAAKQAGHRVVAVGTTSVRVLESVAAANQGQLRPGGGSTRLFVYPPYSFQIVDRLLTNFHLPQSTLLMLVCAFAAPGTTSGRKLVLDSYADAIRQRYRFFSYGDAMFLT